MNKSISAVASCPRIQTRYGLCRLWRETGRDSCVSPTTRIGMMDSIGLLDVIISNYRYMHNRVGMTSIPSIRLASYVLREWAFEICCYSRRYLYSGSLQGCDLTVRIALSTLDPRCRLSYSKRHDSIDIQVSMISSLVRRRTHPSMTNASTVRPSNAPALNAAVSPCSPNVAKSNPASLTLATSDGTAACTQTTPTDQLIHFSSAAKLTGSISI